MGEWKENKQNGFGFIINYQKKSEHRGNCKKLKKKTHILVVNGLLQGHGIFIDLKGGDMYEGNWINGKKDSYGIYIWGRNPWKGHIYEGGYKEGKMHGWGRYLFPSGAYYEGSWYEGEMHGYGV